MHHFLKSHILKNGLRYKKIENENLMLAILLLRYDAIITPGALAIESVAGYLIYKRLKNNFFVFIKILPREPTLKN